MRVVLKGGAELIPASVRYGFGQVSIPHHFGNPQVFNENHVVLTHQPERHLVLEVLSLAPRFLMLLGHQLPGCVAPFTALLAAR